MKKAVVATALLGGTLVSACAQSPSAIAPVSMAGAYTNTSCSQAANILHQEQTRLAALSSKQEGAVVGDAVGVFLIGVPVSSLSGADVSGDIAATKGKVLALQAKLTNC
nr:hypothetical protein [uncultured Ruegeria sp.]